MQLKATTQCDGAGEGGAAGAGAGAQNKKRNFPKSDAKKNQRNFSFIFFLLASVGLLAPSVGRSVGRWLGPLLAFVVAAHQLAGPAYG